MMQSVSPRRLSPADTAKAIRPVLKAAFPGVKFSVRSHSYSMGASIGVHWTDGPTDDAVNAVTRGFEGGRFDSMTDLKYHADSWLCPQHGATAAGTWGHSNGSDDFASTCCAKGELVRFGADFVHTRRAISAELQAFGENKVARMTGQPYERDARVWNEYMSTLVHRELRTVAVPTDAQMTALLQQMPAAAVAAITGTDDLSTATIPARLLLAATADRMAATVTDPFA